MKRIVFLAIMFGLGVGVYAQDYDDDIYYNPKKEKKENNNSPQKQSFIVDFDNVDVDAYNRRGTYYESPIDTIGQNAQNGEDFIYTQQIQKFYNPTIVTENEDILEDILANSYGNVEIVYNGFAPTFMPYYSYSPYWNWNYYGWNSPWFYANNWGWGIGIYDPWYWGNYWGPSWGWNHCWGPGWGPIHHPVNPPYNYRPVGNHRVGPNDSWASNTRPGGAYYGGNTHTSRPGVSAKPAYWETSGSNLNNHRQPTATKSSSTGGYVINNNGHRVSGSSASGSSSSSGVTNTHRNRTNTTQKNVGSSTTNSNSNNKSYQTNRSNNQTNTTHRSSSSWGSSNSRSSGSGTSRGHSSGGGGGRGRHR